MKFQDDFKFIQKMFLANIEMDGFGWNWSLRDKTKCDGCYHETFDGHETKLMKTKRWTSEIILWIFSDVFRSKRKLQCTQNWSMKFREKQIA